MFDRWKNRKDIRIIRAWIEDNKILRCRAVVDDVDVYFKAAEVGVADPNGEITTLDSMKKLFSSIQAMIKKANN